MIREGTHVECCNNEGAPNLVIGSIYYVDQVLKPRGWRRLWARLQTSEVDDVWGVLLFNDPTPYHHSHFCAPRRPVTSAAFNLKSSPPDITR
jgi:hypothetical protein